MGNPSNPPPLWRTFSKHTHTPDSPTLARNLAHPGSVPAVAPFLKQPASRKRASQVYCLLHIRRQTSCCIHGCYYFFKRVCWNTTHSSKNRGGGMEQLRAVGKKRGSEPCCRGYNRGARDRMKRSFFFSVRGRTYRDMCVQDRPSSS